MGTPPFRQAIFCRHDRAQAIRCGRCLACLTMERQCSEPNKGTRVRYGLWVSVPRASAYRQRYAGFREARRSLGVSSETLLPTQISPSVSTL